MKFIDLCAGIGGFSLGLEWAGMTCAGQVEIDPFCSRVLERHWPHVPRWKDLKNEREHEEYPAVDLVCGGYPCQPFSHAGKRKGAEDERHLWPHVFAVVQRLRPAWCLFENVAGHVSLGLDMVLSDLESGGYACRPLVVPACGVDAPHIRNRVWILAHAKRPERRPPKSRGNVAHREITEREKEAGWAGAPGQNGGSGVLADADGQWESQQKGREPEKWRRIGNSDRQKFDVHFDPNGARFEKFHSATIPEKQGIGSWLSAPEWREWPIEPGMGRVAHGIPYRLDRCAGLGNAVVPQVVEAFGLAIMAAMEEGKK